MREAARVILQQAAAGVPKSRIVDELQRQGIFLPDAEGFIDAITRAKPGLAAVHPAAEAGDARGRIALLFGTGFISGFALSWTVALAVGMLASLLTLGFADLGGKLMGGIAGVWFTVWSKERESMPLTRGALAGNVAFVLSVAVLLLLRA